MIRVSELRLELDEDESLLRKKAGKVLRTDPKPQARNFEPNYLAIIDFDPPDFPWMLTPAQANADDRVGAGFRGAQVSAHAGEQAWEADRLHDVVVAARVEAEDRVGVGACIADDQDWREHAALAQEAAGVAAIHVRQIDAEDDQIGALRADHAEALLRRRGGVDDEFMGFEIAGERIVCGRIAVDDEDGLLKSH